jgi:hypothetical protein
MNDELIQLNGGAPGEAAARSGRARWPGLARALIRVGWPDRRQLNGGARARDCGPLAQQQRGPAEWRRGAAAAPTTDFHSPAARAAGTTIPQDGQSAGASERAQIT